MFELLEALLLEVKKFEDHREVRGLKIKIVIMHCALIVQYNKYIHLCKILQLMFCFYVCMQYLQNMAAQIQEGIKAAQNDLLKEKTKEEEEEVN